MENRKTIKKWFWVWDFEKEEDWLNEMAINGWVLESVGFCTYHLSAVNWVNILSVWKCTRMTSLICRS